MEYFLQQLINGLTLGAIYGLIAIGYTMVYGIVGMINFAHGEVFMISAFIGLIGFRLLQSTGIGSAPHGPPCLGPPPDRLSATARLLQAGEAHQRHRHVDLPAELCAAVPGGAV